MPSILDGVEEDKQNPFPNRIANEYDEEIAPASDKNHFVMNSDVFLLFGVGQSTVTSAHKKIIDEKVVPFLVRALKKLGPGDYNVIVYGFASATGNTFDNGELASRRASNVAKYAVKRVLEIQKTDPQLEGRTVQYTTTSVGEEYSRKERNTAEIGNKKPYSESHVEKNQFMWRSAAFRLKARRQITQGSTLYEIREVYKFDFVQKSKPLPKIVEDIKRIRSEYPVVAWLFDHALDNRLDKLLSKMGPMGKIAEVAIAILEYSAPSEITNCFEFKDYLNTKATYVYTAEGHQFSISLLPLFEIIAEGIALYEFLKTLAQNYPKASEILEVANFLEDKITKLINALGARSDAFSKIIGHIKARSKGALYIEASNWQAFRFKDGASDWDIRNLQGLANVYRIIVLGFESSRVQFGTPRAGSSWSFAADVEIRKNFSLLLNGFFGNQTSSVGRFILLK